MKKFAIFAGLMMLMGCFAGLTAALDPLDDGDADADPDRDNLDNAQEFLYGTDPYDADSDGAGAYDGWEVWFETHRAVKNADTGETYLDDAYHFDPNYAEDEGVVSNPNTLIQVRDGDASMSVNDPDNDGWNNYHEFLVGSDPTNPNTDGDRYDMDSGDPDPLVSNDDGQGGDGNGGDGSGQGLGMGAGSGQGNGGGGSGIMG